jgi:hypothetical protein
MLTLGTLAKAIRLAEQFNDMSMMCQAIKQRGGQTFIAKDLNPISELEVGSNDQSETFVKFGTESEKGLRTILRERDKAQFIQNDQVQFEGGGNETV